MYTAKGSGKNASGCSSEMHLAAVERLDLEVHLRGAADAASSSMHYQPIYEMRTGRIAAFEALVRWQHPERGCSRPMSFIPFAEAGGLIDELGRQVLETACSGGSPVGRSDEVGTATPPRQRQPIAPSLLDVRCRVTSRCRRAQDVSGLRPASSLILEITEGALIKDTAAPQPRLAPSGARYPPRGRRLRYRLLLAQRTCSSSPSTCSRSTARS